MECPSWYEKQAHLYGELAHKARTEAGRAHFLNMEETFRRLDRLAGWLDGRVSPFARASRHAETELREAA